MVADGGTEKKAAARVLTKEYQLLPMVAGEGQ
jgi:hypothetical protein